MITRFMLLLAVMTLSAASLSRTVQKDMPPPPCLPCTTVQKDMPPPPCLPCTTVQKDMPPPPCLPCTTVQ
jgi:hypothetical protein